jgi:NADH-quinone oxidoreductase subunit N
MNFQAGAPLVVLAAGIAAMLASLAIRRSALACSLLAGGTLVAAGAAIPWAMQSPAGGGLFCFDSQSLGFIGLNLLTSFLMLVIAHGYWQRCGRVPTEEFALLLLIAALGACALAAAANFIALFLGLETMTLALIGMIAYPRYRPEAGEAALKYLVLSGMSSAFVLFGIGLIELDQGGLDLTRALAAQGDPMLIAGIAMIGVGAGFKLSVVPFHVWVPDIYAGAPAPAGGLVAVIPKIAVLAILTRVMAMPGVALSPAIVDTVTIIAVLSMLVGNLLALLQENIKRVLGYSSIAHLGYLLVAILAGGSIGRTAVVFYIVTYAITMVAAFGVVSVISDSSGARDAAEIDDLRGLFWTRPALAAVMTMVLLSLAGIPPAIGFIGKMYVFAAGVHADLWVLAATMVASSVIGLFYYLNIIIVMTQRRGQAVAPSSGISLPGRLAIAFVSMPMLAFGIAPQPLISVLKTLFG